MINFDKFRRITTSGDYFAEIDGLRFIAIISVILFHLTTSIKYPTIDSLSDNDLITLIYRNGRQGVELFFVISGFIIGLPFARHYINGGKSISIKSYFQRRITRLEPPYFIALTFASILLLISGQWALSEIFPSLISSIFYINTFIYDNVDKMVISVIWSLEIEVQFYILAVLIVKIFKLPKFKRRLLLIFLIMLFPFFHVFYYPAMPTLYKFIQYFLLGFLLADLYLDESRRFCNNNILYSIAGLFLLIIILYLNLTLSFFHELLYLTSILGFYFIVMSNEFWKKIMSNKYIAITGGMCYSIYLVHSPIISAFSRISNKFSISDYFLPNLLLNTVICIPIILIISAIFFRLFERPFMNRNWVTNLINKFKQKSRMKN